MRGPLVSALLLVLLLAPGCRRSGEPLGQLRFEGLGAQSTVLQVPPQQELFFRIEGEAIGMSGRSVGDHRGRYVLRLALRSPDTSTTLECDPLHLGNSGRGAHKGADVRFEGDIQDCVARPAPAGSVELDVELSQPGLTDIGLTHATLTAYAAPARAPDAASARWWEGAEMSKLEKGISFAIFTAILGLVLGLYLRRDARRRATRERIWTTGLPGVATVLKLSDAGGSINDNPRVELALEITPEGRPPFQTRAQIYVDTLAIPRVQPGCTIAVRLDRQDPQQLVFDPEIEVYP